VAVTLAACVGAGAVHAGAQGLWDDPAFAAYRQGVEAMERKDYARAGALASEAIAQYPGHLLAYYLRAQAAAAQSHWDEAVEALSKMIELYPGSFSARRDLGSTYEHMNRLEDAARAYEGALALRDTPELRVHLALVLAASGQPARALPMLEALAARDPESPQVWAALGQVHFAKGELVAAEKSLVRATTLRDEGRTWFNLGVVRTRLNDVPGALKAFERAAAHPETREQAEREARRVREAVLLGGGAPGERRPLGPTETHEAPKPR
jgi:tetratricopeptide (TPR) repeat protein